MPVRALTISILPLLLVLAVPYAGAQVKGENPKIRLAQSYETAGKFEEAAAIYKELHASDPTNIVFFEGLRRTYMQLKRYEDAILLLRERITANPRDVNLRAQLGSVLYKAGREAEANTEWDQAIALDPANPVYYRAVAAVLTENRLLEQTADLYRLARTSCGDQNLFTMELAQLLAISMDYAGATREFIRYLRTNPNQLSFVESKMAGMTAHKEGREAALAETRKAANDDLPQIYELLAWLSLEAKEYEDALDVVRKVDDLTKAKGARIYAFAERAFREKEFAVAARAYQEAIDLPVVPARIPAARYGYASCLKEMSILADSTAGISRSAGETPATEAMPRYSGAIASFNTIIQDYPLTEYSARARYQIGLIQLERFFDTDGALKSFEAVERELPGTHTVSYEVALKIGQTLVITQDTAGAAMRFRSVISALHSTPDQQDEAIFRLAELEYFRGQFKEATSRLEGLTVNLKADYANDALQLLAFLQENTASASGALRDYSGASYLIRQRKISEAIPILESIVKRYASAPLVDDALMTLAGLQADIGQEREAITTFERLLKEHAETSIALDLAQFRIGEIYQFRLNDKTNAIAAYEKLLANYPQSIHLTEARKRIRGLRGETL